MPTWKRLKEAALAGEAAKKEKEAATGKTGEDAEKQQEAERRKREEEEEEQAQKRREEARRAKREQEEAEEAERKRQAEAERVKRENEEAERKRQEEADRAKREQEEAERQRQEEAERARREEEAAAERRRQEEEEERARREKEAEEERRRLEESERAKREQEEAERKRQEEADRARREEEAAAERKRQEEEAERLRCEQEAEAERRRREDEEVERVKREQEAEAAAIAAKAEAEARSRPPPLAKPKAPSAPDEEPLSPGSLPLVLAVKARDLQRVVRLLEEGADPNIEDAMGETPIYKAAERHLPDVVAILLVHGADSTWENKAFTQPTEYADVETENLMLLYQGKPVDEDDKAESLQMLSPAIRERFLEGLKRVKVKAPADEEEEEKEDKATPPEEEAEEAAPPEEAAQEAAEAGGETAEAPVGAEALAKAEEVAEDCKADVAPPEAVATPPPSGQDPEPPVGEPEVIDLSDTEASEMERQEGRAEDEEKVADEAASKEAEESAAAEARRTAAEQEARSRIAAEEALKKAQIEEEARTSREAEKRPEEVAATAAQEEELEKVEEEKAKHEEEKDKEQKQEKEEKEETEVMEETEEKEEKKEEEEKDKKEEKEEKEEQEEKDTKEEKDKKDEKDEREEKEEKTEVETLPSKGKAESPSHSTPIAQHEPEEAPPPVPLDERLARAVSAGNLPLARELLSQGADPNVADAEGETPLFRAAELGSVDLVAELLLGSADPGKESRRYLTACDYAGTSAVEALLGIFQGIRPPDVTTWALRQALSGTAAREAVMEQLQRIPPVQEPEGAEWEQASQIIDAVAEQVSALMSAVRRATGKRKQALLLRVRKLESSPDYLAALAYAEKAFATLGSEADGDGSGAAQGSAVGRREAVGSSAAASRGAEPAPQERLEVRDAKEADGLAQGCKTEQTLEGEIETKGLHDAECKARREAERERQECEAAKDDAGASRPAAAAQSVSSGDLSNSIWDWADDGTNVTATLRLLPDGSIARFDCNRSSTWFNGSGSSTWRLDSADPSRLVLTVSSSAHVLRLQGGGARRAALEEPSREPAPAMSRWDEADFELLVRHAVDEGARASLVLPFDATFADAKAALARQVGSEAIRQSGRLVRPKGQAGLYVSCKESSYIGQVRQVFLLGVDLKASA